MMSLWYIYILVAVLLVICLVIVAIGFSRSGRRRATEFRGVARTEHDETHHKGRTRAPQHP
ncbi:hypothetical protein KSF_024920 [Reticulibacter mediterranei]|uniref:Uncharacterized protein n=1 Tax=Reticulibacter mediterranei TaxID=2778369 RepID=A0A8J3IBP5_9CHLR|nr:hypothetical protein [Reticulibacter mediterranei]GHO92444.1 hypothetical protein KSF_024920 [Reticulibacter mediterranei]